MTNQGNPFPVLDLRGVLCPINYVKTTLRLEKMAVGEVLEVCLDEGEPARNVPESVTLDGHEVMEIAPSGSGGIAVRIRKR